MTDPGRDVLAFDIGGTHLRSARVAADGTIGSRRDVRTPVESEQAFVEALVSEAGGQLGAARAAGGPAPAAIGVAMAGYTDTRRGLVYDSPSLGLHAALIGPPLSAATGLPVRLVNDVNAAAVAEAAAWKRRDLVALFVGTGVGGGFVCDGRLVEGHRGMAAEAGHAIWRAGGIPCNAGHAGCYQAYLGGAALALRARESGLPGDTAALVAAWRAGDAGAGVIMRDALDAMAALCTLLVTLLDPRTIAIAGGVGRAVPELIEVARSACDPHPLSADAEPVEVVAARTGDDAGLLGAAILARKELLAG